MRFGTTIKYATLPQIAPRLRELMGAGLNYVPFFIALVYQAVRILPANHPYVNPANIGRYGVRHVIAEAANHLVISRKNIDQIILFGTILLGLGLMVLQIALLGFSLMFQPAMAAFPTGFTGFFVTPAADAPNDIAFIFLDMVFGVNGLFNSCIATAAVCVGANGQPVDLDLTGLGWPFPIHAGLHAMFQVYSLGLLVVATFIAMYFMVTVVMETAQTGTPFGKRFNKVWAPIRIVVAFGLLVPLTTGLNSSQYIVLYAAKFGSSFATNGWNLFNATLAESYLGNVQNLVTEPNLPEVGTLMQFMYVARTCAEAYNLDDEVAIHPAVAKRVIAPYLVREQTAAPPNALIQSATTYEDLLAFLDGQSTAVIRFGIKREGDDDAKHFIGFVEPTCGELKLPMVDPRDPTDAANPPEKGAEIMQRYYWFIIKELWYDEIPNPVITSIDSGYTFNAPEKLTRKYMNVNPDPDAPLPGPEYKAAFQSFYNDDLGNAMTCGCGAAAAIPGLGAGALPEQINQVSRWGVDTAGTWQPTTAFAIQRRGWAGAGIWYNKVAQLNGAVTGAVLNIPRPSMYPMVMEYVSEKKKQQDQNFKMQTRFEPKLADGKDVPGLDKDAQKALVMWEAYRYWDIDDATSTSHTSSEGNIVLDTINQIFGTNGLMSMRTNDGKHPLAKLVGLGSALKQAAISSFAVSAGAAFGAAIDDKADGVAKFLVGIFMTIVTIAMSLGFVLYYVIPFLPFIYFFFAVSGWIKGIFEAMVGAPLWALAHIRIDGNGLPGQAAVAGYFLIFEIFLRPILIVFGMLASISIFSALVATMNETWDLVTANLGGFDVEEEITTPLQVEFFRSGIDEFFFTVVYTIVVYMMAMASFKLIDLIPNNILRWMGQSLATFNDQREDPAAGLMQTAAIGGQQTMSQVGGGLKGGLQQIIEL